MSSKRPASHADDDIVCSSWEHEEVIRKRNYRNTRNSTYGALLSPHFRFGRKELGASVTACGRQITTHMMETIHNLLEPDKPANLVKTTEVEKDGSVSHVYIIDSDTVIYGDTDSVDGSTLVRTSMGVMPVGKLFDFLPIKWESRYKQFAAADHLTSPCFTENGIQDRVVKAVYRHKVRKPRWKITLEDGKEVIVTGDHSIMVRRNGNLIEVKPADINRDTDTCITIETGIQCDDSMGK